MSDLKGNNTNSTGFQVLEFPNCHSPCLHQAVSAFLGRSEGLMNCQPDPVQGLYFRSWPTSVWLLLMEQPNSHCWADLQCKVNVSSAQNPDQVPRESLKYFTWLLFVWLLDSVILIWKGHSSKSEKLHKVLSQLVLHMRMGKDWTVKTEVFLLMFLFNQQGMNSTENTGKVSAPCSGAELSFTLWFYPLIDFWMLSFAASHL